MILREVNQDDEIELNRLYEEYFTSEPISGIDIFEGIRDLERFGQMDFKTWLNYLNSQKNKENLPQDYSTHTFYLAENKDKRIVGGISLRWEEVPILMNFGGFIGYSIRPSERGKGYATEMLKLGLQKFKEIDNKKEKVLITCKDFNTPSKRVIENNKGIYENSCFNTDNGYTYLRYWIKL